MKPKIESNELKRLIAVKSDKIDFDDVTEEDIISIQDITLNAYLINGKNSDVKLSDMLYFPNLRKIRVCNYNLNDRALDLFIQLEDLKNIEIINCKLDNINFDKLNGKLSNISFSNCGELNFKYPIVKDIIVNRTGIDFTNIDFSNAKNVSILNSLIKRVHGLTEYDNLENVTFDGSTLYDEQGKILTDIPVAKSTRYSHEKENMLCDSYSYNREM